MAQASQTDEQILLILKIDNKGWNTALFEDKTAMKFSLCKGCNLVCCDAVELGCDHNDNDICSYCNACLAQLISDNNNNCPIDGHKDPIISPLRSMRRQILKSLVFCPYSKQYKQNNNNNVHVIDTFGGDEKEGSNNIHVEGCNFKGTLKNLIQNHLSECVKRYNPSFSQIITMNALKTVNEQKQKINQLINALNVANDEIAALKIGLNQSKQENEALNDELIKLGLQLTVSNQQNTILSGQISQFTKQIRMNEQKEQEIDRFVVCGSAAKITGKNHNKVETIGGGSWSCAYGHIKTIPTRNVLYEWKFKLGGGNWMLCGISSAQKPLDKFITYGNKTDPVYALHTGMGMIYTHAKSGGNAGKYSAGDVITMQVNTKTKTLEFYKESKKIHKMQIDKSSSYNMAVCLSGTQKFIELIDFSETNL